MSIVALIFWELDVYECHFLLYVIEGSEMLQHIHHCQYQSMTSDVQVRD